MNNHEITKALEILKKTCEENQECCTKCPLGYSINQNGGDNCKLAHIHPQALI